MSWCASCGPTTTLSSLRTATVCRPASKPNAAGRPGGSSTAEPTARSAACRRSRAGALLSWWCTTARPAISISTAAPPLFIPSYFCRRTPVSLADPGLPPVLVYPVSRPVPRASPDRTGAPLTARAARAHPCRPHAGRRGPATPSPKGPVAGRLETPCGWNPTPGRTGRVRFPPEARRGPGFPSCGDQ